MSRGCRPGTRRRVRALTPPLVVKAQALAAELGFEKSCTDEDGGLLHVLAARRGLLRVGEIGTGAGVGAAWIVSALRPGTPFVTVELDERLAASAATLFAHDPDVTVLHGSWQDVMPPQAPFDFLFVDGGKAKDDPDAILGLVAQGGTIVMDDFAWDPAEPDPRRDRWLSHPEAAAVEIWTAPTRRAIVGTRR
jgi:predicted O-methyltransferase YrrM